MPRLLTAGVEAKMCLMHLKVAIVGPKFPQETDVVAQCGPQVSFSARVLQFQVRLRINRTGCGHAEATCHGGSINSPKPTHLKLIAFGVLAGGISVKNLSKHNMCVYYIYIIMCYAYVNTHIYIYVCLKKICDIYIYINIFLIIYLNLSVFIYV